MIWIFFLTLYIGYKLGLWDAKRIWIKALKRNQIVILNDPSRGEMKK